MWEADGLCSATQYYTLAEKRGVQKDRNIQCTWGSNSGKRFAWERQENFEKSKVVQFNTFKWKVIFQKYEDFTFKFSKSTFVQNSINNELGVKYKKDKLTSNQDPLPNTTTRLSATLPSELLLSNFKKANMDAADMLSKEMYFHIMFNKIIYIYAVQTLKRW